MTAVTPCECCEQPAERVVRLETGTSFASFAFCTAHYEAFKRLEARLTRPRKVTEKEVTQ